jgi:hypothetical protein
MNGLGIELQRKVCKALNIGKKDGYLTKFSFAKLMFLLAIQVVFFKSEKARIEDQIVLQSGS